MMATPQIKRQHSHRNRAFRIPLCLHPHLHPHPRPVVNKAQALLQAPTQPMSHQHQAAISSHLRAVTPPALKVPLATTNSLHQAQPAIRPRTTRKALLTTISLAPVRQIRIQVGASPQIIIKARQIKTRIRTQAVINPLIIIKAITKALPAINPPVLPTTRPISIPTNRIQVNARIRTLTFPIKQTVPSSTDVDLMTMES